MPKTSRSTPCPTPRLLLRLLLMMISASLCFGLRTEQLAAQAPPAEEQLVRVTPRVVRQCAADAAAVDGLESRLRACQRDLDASSGALAEARHAAQDERAEVVRLTMRVVQLETASAARWSPWAWMGVGAGGAVALLLTGLLIAR